MVLSSPIVIHVHRPYASEEEYLAHESFSIDARSMLLIDQAPLPPDTLIVFDVSLDDGQKLIRAEGKVTGYVAPDANFPGGLRVRFRRFGAATKAFIDRAVACSPRHSVAPSAPTSTRSMPPYATSLPPEADLPAPASTAKAEEANETSGVHRKVVSPVAAPANREALLDRLRSRRAS